MFDIGDYVAYAKFGEEGFVARRVSRVKDYEIMNGFAQTKILLDDGSTHNPALVKRATVMDVLELRVNDD